MKQVRILMALAIGVAMAPTGAAGGLDNPGVVYELEVRDTGSASIAQQVSMKIEGANLKMSTKNAGSDTPDEVIFRTERKEMLIVDHGERTYMVMDQATLEGLAEQMRQMAERLQAMPPAQREMVERMMQGRGGAGATAPPVIEFRDTGERGEHAGYATRRVDMYADERKTHELWITDWSNMEGADEARPAFVALAEFGKQIVASLSQIPMLQGMETNNSFAALASVDGFPILTRDIGDNGQVVRESAFKSATIQAIAPSEFEPPDGYRQQTMGR